MSATERVYIVSYYGAGSDLYAAVFTSYQRAIDFCHIKAVSIDRIIGIQPDTMWTSLEDGSVQPILWE